MLVAGYLLKHSEPGIQREGLGSARYLKTGMKAVAERLLDRLAVAALPVLPQCCGVHGGAFSSNSERLLLPLYPTHSSATSSQPLTGQPVIPKPVADWYCMRTGTKLARVAVVQAGGIRMRRRAIADCRRHQLHSKQWSAAEEGPEYIQQGIGLDKEFAGEFDSDRRGLHQERLPERGTDSSVDPP